VEWATDGRGNLPAREYYRSLDEEDRAKMNALFGRLAAFGQISNREKFKNLKPTAPDLWEFKSFQLRFIGDFRRGGRFLVAHAVRKKKDNLDRPDIEIARRVLRANDDYESETQGRGHA